MNSKSHPTEPPSTADTTNPSSSASILAGASSARVYGGEFNNSQRDQNTHTYNGCTLLYVGDSNSDISRINLAAGESSRSGSVVNTPSDQEESEKPSIFTDSGFGGSDAPSEIESPPTEQESPVEEETSNAIYKRHMYLKGRGEPLFIPSPNMRLSRSYRKQGVKPGDVGVFTSDGGFDFLFNIFLPAGDPRNPDELPEGFYPLDLKPADVFESRAHCPHSHLASPSVKKKGSLLRLRDANEGVIRARFECSGSDGAILIMPQGNYYEDLRNIIRLREYASAHAESWYEYANGPCGRGIGQAELHLVTGCDKTTSWAIASYSNLQSKRFKNNVTSLNFDAVSNEHQGRHPSYMTYFWDHEGAVEAKAGPEDDELADLLEDRGSAPLRNQCTFVWSFTLALGDDAWKCLELKVAAFSKAQASPLPSHKGPFASVLGAIISLQGLIGSLHSHGSVGMSSLADSMRSAQTPVVHPATYVVNLLLQKCPKANIIVVHDSDWCSVIQDSDHDWMATSQNLQHCIQEVFEIVGEENGAVCLQEKMRLSQQPHTLSHVSFKLEDEHFNLLRDQKPEFLQLFNSFDTTLSDAKADSPSQSFEKLLEDQDGNIKPKTSMSQLPNRRKGGCWTCRVRQKKCDEQQEGGSCKTCRRLTIKCLGWGPNRPDWMRDKKNVDDYRASIKAQLSRAGLICGQPRPNPIQAPSLWPHSHHAPASEITPTTTVNQNHSGYIFHQYGDMPPYGQNHDLQLMPGPPVAGGSNSALDHLTTASYTDDDPVTVSFPSSPPFTSSSVSSFPLGADPPIEHLSLFPNFLNQTPYD